MLAIASLARFVYVLSNQSLIMLILFVTVRPIDENSHLDLAELAEMHRILRAVVNRMGNCSFFFQNASGWTASAGWICSALYCISSATLTG